MISLPGTDLSTLSVGMKVLCYQPPATPIEPTDLYKISHNGKVPGWWAGNIESIEAGWATVVSMEIGAKNDYNGCDCPIYDVQNLPPALEGLFESSDHMTSFFEEVTRRTLEEEFFERATSEDE